MGLLMQPAFLSTLQVRLHSNTWCETTWELVAPLKYRTIVRGEPELVEVSKHFVTDFASIPRIPFFWWLAKGVMQRPAVIHDWLYTTGEYERETCDLIFLEAGRAENVNIFLRGGMYAVIRTFGWATYNK